jgi:hypothetical protein
MQRWLSLLCVHVGTGDSREAVSAAVQEKRGGSTATKKQKK